MQTLKSVDSLAKSRLRALNLQNQTTHPVHNDFNLKYLQKSWKLWYQLFFSTINLANQITYIRRLSFFKTTVQPFNNTRKLKKFLYLSKDFISSKKVFIINKKYWTSVKVILSSNRLVLIFINCPISRLSNIFKKKVRVVKRRKFFSKKYL